MDKTNQCRGCGNLYADMSGYCMHCQNGKKTILDKIHAQLDGARRSGVTFCAFTAEDTQAILSLIEAQHAEFVRMENSWRREVQRVRDEYNDERDFDYDEEYGPPEDRDCAYWERVFRDGL